jgi:predicted RNase H-like HicB family nuclease
MQGDNMTEYTILLTWDDEAYVWLASSEDVPGLALESGSLDALMERVKYAVPDLLGLKDTDNKINIKAERLAEVHV